MTTPKSPSAVLSEHFQERMQGRHLVSALFTTFRFEPGFFETDILPAFFDVPLSHAAPIKRVQLEETLRSLPGHIAVYYDPHGLVAEGGSAKLDIRRIPIQHRTGIFHPKVVFALIEADEADEKNHRPRTLLCACLSANLTRAGWWSNVEAAHVEELAEGEHTTLRKPLLDFLDGLIKEAEYRRANETLRQEHSALWDIRQFLLSTSQRENRSVSGRLLTQFHNGYEAVSLPDFLVDATRGALSGMCLEVIAPYLDEAAESEPLQALMDRFQPKEVRVFLPRNDRGEALCSDALYTWLRKQPDTTLGTLPTDLLRLSKQEGAKHRTVHAKVYRFFDPTKGGREILYVGSANLTRPAFRLTGAGGNVEAGFVVEATSAGKPDFWLESDTRRPAGFAPRGEDEGCASSGGTLLVVRYTWNRQEAAVLWGGESASPKLSVEHGGVCIFQVADLAPRSWVVLGKEDAARLERTLHSTSLLQVRGEKPEPALLLVQEEGMSHRPSLLLDLSPAEILRYWSLLSVEQRAAFIEAHARMPGDDDPMTAKVVLQPVQESLFDRFAGIFHAFSCLEERVRQALEDRKFKEADYRLFGKKYDSLGSLLARVVASVEKGEGDRVDQYVMGLCAKQTLRELERAYPAYWAEHESDIRELNTQLKALMKTRDGLAAANAEMPEFLKWFEKWFLRRAESMTTEDAS